MLRDLTDAPTDATALPEWPTRLIDREADRERLRALLRDRGARLVVVTGPGGVGKTRLAVAVAEELRDRYRHGVRFLPLAAIPDRVDLDATIARYLGLRDTDAAGHRDLICRFLQTRELLLVLDGADHVPEAIELLTEIQARCPGIVMLVTSRVAFGVYGEITHQVYPLAHRVESLLPKLPPDRLVASDAVQLFRDRARMVAPDFEVTAEAAGTIAAICEHLGGLPLAIELTAPRVARESPAALLDELVHSPAFAPPGAVMDATIRRSYDRLPPDGQRVFRSLCIMCGRWTIDDVLPIMPPGVDELKAIAHLDALVDSSLITGRRHADEDHRFTVNPVLRQFGRARLAETGESRAVADRHAARMVALAEEAAPELTGPRQGEWLARLDALYDDMGDAHAHLLDHDQPVEALRLATALWRYAYTHGHYREGRAMIEAALPRVSHHDALRARALNGVGLLSNLLRDADAARAAHRRALELAEAHDLGPEIAMARIGLADVEVSFTQDLAAALHHLDHAAAAYERARDVRGVALVLTNRGNIVWMRGQLDRAFAAHEEARVLYAQVRDTRGMAWSDTNTGRIAARQHRYDEAVPRLRAALDGYVEIGDAYGITEVLEALAGVAAGTDELETASVLAGAATSMRVALGAPLKQPDLEEFQATLAAARQSPRHEEAYARGTRLTPEEAVAIARAVPVPETTAASPGGAEHARTRYGITPREYEVLRLLGEGLTDQQIADRLNISVRTAQTYTSALLRKLDVPTRTLAARAARQAGLIP